MPGGGGGSLYCGFLVTTAYNTVFNLSGHTLGLHPLYYITQLLAVWELDTSDAKHLSTVSHSVQMDDITATVKWTIIPYLNMINMAPRQQYLTNLVAE